MTTAIFNLLCKFSYRILATKRILLVFMVSLLIYTVYLLLSTDYIDSKWTKNVLTNQLASSDKLGINWDSVRGNEEMMNKNENFEKENVILSSDKYNEGTSMLANGDNDDGSLNVLVAGKLSLLQDGLKLSNQEQKKKLKEFFVSYPMMPDNDNVQYHINYFDELITTAANANGEEIKLIQVNAAFLIVTYNLLCSLRRAKMDNGVLLWAMDAISFDTIHGYGYPVYFDSTLPASSEFQHYHSEVYNKLMRARLRVFHRIVHLGVKFWFIDADSAVKNNFEHLSKTNLSMMIQTDLGYTRETSEEHIPWACAGIFFMNNNAGSRYITSTWLKLSEEKTHLEDQQLLNILVRAKNIQVENGPVRDRSLVKASIKFLPRKEFFNGHMLKNMDDEKLEALKSAYMLHVNGYGDKKKQLSKYNYWFLDGRGMCKVK